MEWRWFLSAGLLALLVYVWVTELKTVPSGPASVMRRKAMGAGALAVACAALIVLLRPPHFWGTVRVVLVQGTMSCFYIHRCVRYVRAYRKQRAEDTVREVLTS